MKQRIWDCSWPLISFTKVLIQWQLASKDVQNFFDLIVWRTQRSVWWFEFWRQRPSLTSFVDKVSAERKKMEKFWFFESGGRQRHHSCVWPGLYILGQPVPVSLRGLRLTLGGLLYEYHYISGVGGLVTKVLWVVTWSIWIFDICEKQCFCSVCFSVKE